MADDKNIINIDDQLTTNDAELEPWTQIPNDVQVASEEEPVLVEVPIPEEESTEPVEEEPVEESTEESTEEEPAPKLEDISQMLDTIKTFLSIMEQQWLTIAKEYGITDKHMLALTEWNEAHKDPMPDNLTEEERDNWDHWNGLNHLTEDAVAGIFPEGHPIYGENFGETMDRIKEVGSSYLGWVTTLKEYRDVQNAYNQLIEFEEENNMLELKKKADEEEDPEKKAAFQQSIQMYYDNKYLAFLPRVTPKEQEFILEAVRQMSEASAYSEKHGPEIGRAKFEQTKVYYWVTRSRDKLDAMQISPKIIQEISQFEERFLGDAYKKNNDVLLMYFLFICTHCNPNNKDDINALRVRCMTTSLDAYIRKLWSEERREQLLANVKAFEDIFLPFIQERVKEEEITPPITSENPEDTTEDAPEEVNVEPSEETTDVPEDVVDDVEESTPTE